MICRPCVMVQNSTLGADQIMKKRVNFIYCYGPIQRKIPSQNQEKWQEFSFFRVKINPGIGWLTCHISCQVVRKSEWSGDERGKSKGGRRKWGGWEKRKWEGVRGEGETEHWRYKFDSSIYFRKDWKRSVILKVGTQLATTNQAYQVYWLTQQQFWS